MSSRSDLRRQLEGIVNDASGTLRRFRARENVVLAVPTALRAMVAVPALYLVLLGLSWGVGRPLFVIGFPVLGGLTVLAPLVVLAGAWCMGAFSPVAPELALATVDSALGLEERLLSASELMVVTPRTPFMEAALDDAADHAWRAMEQRLRLQREAAFDRRYFLLCHLTLILLVIAWFLPWPVAMDSAAKAQKATANVASLVPDKAKERPQTPPDPAPDRETVPPGARQAPKGAGSTGQRGTEAELDEKVKETKGRTTTGRASEAASSTGSSESKGAPSNQAQDSQGNPKKTPKKPKKPTKEKPPEKPSDEAKKEDESGSTAGRGAATGSNKSPAASKWSSKDQVTSEDEQDLEDDEDVDDEVDENEARGGVQPGLRDRKPPVNRDLSIGFGNMKSPDASGRGGPGDQKKSRGVATLVLGVPIPDHVKGRPNPGKTKITQERVEPEPEEVAPRPAEARRPRDGEVGPLSRPDLLPWMRQLLRGWFVTDNPSDASEQ